MIRRKPLKALRSPTVIDIAWAAGIYEGEGCVSSSKGSIKVGVTQKDPWLLVKLLMLFGGRIYKYKTRPIFEWHLSGSRSKGFLFTIFTFLSPRRRRQIEAALRRGNPEPVS